MSKEVNKACNDDEQTRNEQDEIGITETESCELAVNNGEEERRGGEAVKKQFKAKSRILWCLLGVFLGLVIAASSIFGVCMYALNADIDNVFGMFGQKNEDKNGNALINPDKNSGGVSSVLDLYNEVKQMTEDLGNLTVGRMVELSPALGVFLNDLYAKADEYGVTVNGEELNATSVVDLGTYLQNVVYAVKPSVFMRKMELSDAVDQNEVIRTMLEGMEASYVYALADDSENGEKYPLFYDEYTYIPELEKYFRTTISDDGEVFPANISESWLMESNKSDENGNVVYRLYYYLVGGENGVNYYIVTKKDKDGKFIFNGAGKPFDDINYCLQVNYGANFQCATGNWYYDNDGNKIILSNVTLKTLSEDALAPLYYLPVTDLLGNDEVVSTIFGLTSVGELLNGQVDLTAGAEKLIRDFAEKVKNSTLTQLVGLGIIDEESIPADEYIPVSVGYKNVGGNVVTVYYRKNIADCTLENIIDSVKFINEEGYAHALLGDEGYEFGNFAE